MVNSVVQYSTDMVNLKFRYIRTGESMGTTENALNYVLNQTQIGQTFN